MTQEDFNNPSTVAKIKVIGVGGAGGNAVNTMIKSSLNEVDFICCNTDVQALKFSLASKKIQIGKELTRGLGAGADPDVGREAAIEDKEELAQALAGADMVFITAGMGGGTGTGAASVVAQIAREQGALTVAVVTKPFVFEGKRRRRHAESGIQRLRESVDTLITIPNQRLLMLGQDDLSMVDAFKMADAVLVNAVQGISDIINIPGILNVDFADVKTVMSSMGQALMGIGRSRGAKRALDAAKMAICSPLLEDIDIEGATGILINITAGNDVKLHEIRSACEVVQNAAHEDAQIIFGAVIDETLGDEMKVTVIATGFPVDKDESIASDSDQKLRKIEQLKSEPLFSTFLHNSQVQSSSPFSSETLKQDSISSEEKISSPLPEVTSDESEVQELALWTFNAPFEPEKPLESMALEEVPYMNNHETVANFADPPLEMFVPEFQKTEMESSQSENLSEEDPHDDFVMSYVSTVSDVIKDKSITDTILIDENELSYNSEHSTKSLEGASKNPPKDLISPSSESFETLDGKMSDAFALSDRLKDFQSEGIIDDLDIPTFLRHRTEIGHS